MDWISSAFITLSSLCIAVTLCMEVLYRRKSSQLTWELAMLVRSCEDIAKIILEIQNECTQIRREESIRIAIAIKAAV